MDTSILRIPLSTLPTETRMEALRSLKECLEQFGACKHATVNEGDLQCSLPDFLVHGSIEQARRATPLRATQGPLQSITVIDTPPHQRESLTRLVASLPYEIREADTGFDALPQIDSNTRLVLLNHRPPEVDGLDTLRIIRSEHPAIPVIMISSLIGSSLVYDAQILGISDFMLKPVQPEYLYKSIERAMRLPIIRRTA